MVRPRFDTDSSGRVGVLELLEPLGGALVRDELGAGVLKRLAARDVIVVVVAVDHIFDRLVGDLPDRIDVLLAALRLAVGDRVCGNDTVLGDDEHRLMVAISEDVDVVGAVDLCGLLRRPLRLGLCRTGQHARQQRGRDGCEKKS
jgi:hypothetical protein